MKMATGESDWSQEVIAAAFCTTATTTMTATTTSQKSEMENNSTTPIEEVCHHSFVSTLKSHDVITVNVLSCLMLSISKLPKITKQKLHNVI
jgi:hypothetical protein